MELRFDTNVPDRDAGRAVDDISRAFTGSREGVSSFAGIIGKAGCHAGSLSAMGGKYVYRTETVDASLAVQAENAIAAGNAIQDVGIATNTVRFRVCGGICHDRANAGKETIQGRVGMPGA